MSTDTTPPNVLLVTTDSLRADAVYTDDAPTPTHDDLAAEGLIYDQAFAQGPFTTFSMPSLFTSRYPSELEYMEFSESTVGVYIDDEPTLPEQLRAAGYETAGFHSNPLLSNLFGFDRGFDTFDARLPLSGTDWLPGRAKILADKLLRLVRTHAYLPAEALTERAIEWLDSRDGDRPFFLWIHYMDVHGPYQAKGGNVYLNKYRGERLWRKAIKRPEQVSSEECERLRELYRTEVEYTDSCIGDLIEGLRSRDEFNDTVAVLTADHGELFGNHGRFSHPHLLHDELTRVPLIVRDPDGPTGQVSEVVELLDVAPTLVERVGSDPPESFTGERLPTTGSSGEPVAISEADLVPAYNGSVRTAEHRYIRNGTVDTETLYHLPTDPRECDDLSHDQPKKLKELSERLDKHLASLDQVVGPDRGVVHQSINDTGVEDRLEDLGYLE